MAFHFATSPPSSFSGPGKGSTEASTQLDEVTRGVAR